MERRAAAGARPGMSLHAAAAAWLLRRRPAGAAAAAALCALALVSSGPAEGVRPVLDRWGRLETLPGKHELACPRQDARVAVLVVAGQSNAGNHGEARPPVARGERIVNLHRGRCWLAASPLLGATGPGAAYWDLLAAQLIDSGRYDHVVLAPFAVGGSRAARWAEGGDLHADWMAMLSQVQRSYRITHILWHQGEADFLMRTPPGDYETQIGSMSRSIRALGIDAPLHIATATRCTLAPWTPDTPIAQAQRRLAALLPGAAPGPDADAVWAPGDRFDDCHLSPSGQTAMARQWARRLLPEMPARRP